MRKLSRYHDRYIQKPAAVLGGGPSLPGDMSRLPAGCVLFAVNYHALSFCKPKFMVYNDRPEDDPLMVQAVREFTGIKLSTDPTTDVLFDVPVWTGFYSGNTAAWLALYMGCAPVLLCGMDLYQGEIKYCHPCDRHTPSMDYPLYDHLRPWIEDGKNLLPHVERLRAMSGPLVDVFGLWDGKI